MSVYALNLFDVSNKEEYLQYAKGAGSEVERYGGKVIALGKYAGSVIGDIEPRTVLIIVEWPSKSAFDDYCADPTLTQFHKHREKGTTNYIWQLFDKLDNLKPLLG